jgi:predicted dehydrogenase
MADFRADAFFSQNTLLTVDALCNGGDWLHNVEKSLQIDDPTPIPPLAPTYPEACQTAQQRAAYGYLTNIFSHNVNLCHYLMGAELEVRFAQFRSSEAMNTVVRCDDVLVTLRGATSASHDWREWTTFTFASGEISIKTPTPMNRQRSAEVTVLRKNGGEVTTTTYHAPIAWAFFRQAQGFVAALAGREPLRAPAETCVWDVRVMQRIIEIAEIV